MSVFSAQITFKNTHQNVAGTALVHTGKIWAGGVIEWGLATPRQAYTRVSLDNVHGSKITFPRQYLCSSSKAVASLDLNVHKKVPPAFPMDFHNHERVLVSHTLKKQSNN